MERLTAEAQNRPYLADGSAASQLQGMIHAQRHAERAFKVETYAQKIEAARVKLAQALSDVASYTERLGLATQVEAKRRELEQLQVGSQLNRLAATDSRVNSPRAESRSYWTSRGATHSGQAERGWLPKCLPHSLQTSS